MLLKSESGPSLDVTHTHLFLGYQPLIIGLAVEKNSTEFEQLTKESTAHLIFRQGDIGKRLATLLVKKISQKELGIHFVFFYEGVQGYHDFLSAFHQGVNRLRQSIQFRKRGNVDLLGNLYDQVRIAYSVPRMISVITVSDGKRINLFPTDLHGPVGKKFYIGSLRKNGLVSAQVERYRKIVMSEVEADGYRQIYALGKNHMKDLREPNGFELHLEKSTTFGYPLPLWVTRYRELAQIDSFDYGIHRIHIYDIVHEQRVNTKDSVLAHIHQYYAQWRIVQKLPTTLLLR